MDRVDNVDLRETLKRIAEYNTVYYLDNDLDISIRQMERAAKLNDYSDKTYMWISYPTGINCHSERQAFQKDTREYNGVLFHGKEAEKVLTLAYAVDVHGIKDGRVYGDLYETDMRDYAAFVEKNAVQSNSIRIYKDDLSSRGEQLVMPKDEFERRYPPDMVKLAYWRNEPDNEERLKQTLDGVWDKHRTTDYSLCDMYKHTDKLLENRYAFYAKEIVENINKSVNKNGIEKSNVTAVLNYGIATAFGPEELSRLLDALPYKNVAFTVQKGQKDMMAVVPRNEIIRSQANQLSKTEKPSLLDTIDRNEKKSRQRFNQTPEMVIKDIQKKSKGEVL